MNTRITTIIKWFVSLVFIGAGVAKLLGLPFYVEQFPHWGYPVGFMYVVGILEIGGALLLLKSKTSLYGTVLLLFVMLGALHAHIRSNDPWQAMIPAGVLFILLIILLLVRRPTAPTYSA